MFDEKSLNDYRLMQQFHRDIERIFLSINRIVPYEHNKNWDVYSPRYVNIVQASNPQILGMFALITKGLGLHLRGDTFRSYYDILNKGGMLKKQKVALRDNFNIIQPFDFQINTPKKTPPWWTGYNKSKHELPVGFFQGTLNNSIYSLAALAVLHDIAVLIKKPRNDLDKFLNSDYWKDLELDFKRDTEDYKGSDDTFLHKILASRQTYFHASTNLFYFLTDYQP